MLTGVIEGCNIIIGLIVLIIVNFKKDLKMHDIFNFYGGVLSFLFVALLGVALISFFAVSATLIICERIAVLRRWKRRGLRKRLARKIRKEIFRRLKARQAILRRRKKQEERIKRYRQP